jgi:3-methyl-2-oxobutanoate hydroxymethyltransferase
MSLLSPMHGFGGKGILMVFGPHPRQQSGAALERTMSLTQLRESGESKPVHSVTAQTLLEMKRAGHAITALTAYDYPTARLVDQAGIDLILVGDSVGMAVLGYESTLPDTMDEMLHHTRAVARGVERAFLVADMPFGSYHSSSEEALHNATRFIKEAGAHAVKIEGGRRRAALVQRMTDAEISVVAHIGLTPQSIHRMSGYHVQGRSVEAIESLYADALALEAAGAVAIVLEGIPREVATEITARSGVPTIGIGAGPSCDGQILVFHDLFNLTFSSPAKFVRRYADAAAFFGSALERYRDDVTARTFPSDQESYHLSQKVIEQLETVEHRPEVLADPNDLAQTEVRESNKDPIEHFAALEPAGRG